jgi:hypothetical protein
VISLTASVVAIELPDSALVGVADSLASGVVSKVIFECIERIERKTIET